jgi:hypothetical protein
LALLETFLIYPNKRIGVCTSDSINLITKEVQSGDYSMIILASIEVSVICCRLIVKCKETFVLQDKWSLSVL